MLGKQISHYQIIEKLGGGGMGVVYKALDIKLDRFVALKFLPPHLSADEETKNRFIQEARAASALDHPNICTIYDIEETKGGQLFIAMACYEGETLKKKIVRAKHSEEDLKRERKPSAKNASPQQRIPLAHAVDIAMQICRGLAKAHEAGIIHRDIKPANIMITNRDEVKIVDFGLAKLAGQTQITKGGSTPGTIAYMSPEQTWGDNVDSRTDIWALGVVLYEMLTGELPFKGNYDQAMIYSILKEEPQKMTGVRNEIPPLLQKIVDKSLAKSPDKRYQQVHEVLKDLQALGGIDKTSTTRLVSIGKRRILKRQRAFYALVSALLFLSLFAYFFFLRSPTLDHNSKNIAVLPFKNLSSDPENEYFSEGIADDIRAQLSKISKLKVRPRRSVLKYKAKHQSLQEIAKDLQVQLILDGSVRYAEERVHIVAMLLDAKKNEQIWAETYERESHDILGIQNDIAQRITSALKMEVTRTVNERLVHKTTTSLSAYHYYLRGRKYLYQNNWRENEHAIELFKKAIQADSNYALAYANLGYAYAQRGAKVRYFPVAWLDSAIVISQKALTIDRNTSDAYKTMGRAYFRKGWYEKALAAYSKAIELDPSNLQALLYTGYIKQSCEDYEAIEWLLKAIEVDPTVVTLYRLIGDSYLRLKDYEKAEQWIKKAGELAPGSAPFQLADFYLEQGRIEEGIALLKRIMQSDTLDEYKQADPALILQGYGKTDLAIAGLKKAIKINPHNAWHYMGLAGVYVEQGLLDDAIALYQQADKLVPELLRMSLSHSFLLSRGGKVKEARTVMERFSGRLPQDHWLGPVVRFYVGEITEADLNGALKHAFIQVKGERKLGKCEISYYLGMAYLYNMNPDLEKSIACSSKARKYLLDYLARSPKDGVENAVVRDELRRLASL